MRIFFSRALDRKFWLIFKNILIDNYKNYEPVRSECPSCCYQIHCTNQRNIFCHSLTLSTQFPLWYYSKFSASVKNFCNTCTEKMPAPGTHLFSEEQTVQVCGWYTRYLCCFQYHHSVKSGFIWKRKIWNLLIPTYLCWNDNIFQTHHELFPRSRGNKY